MSNCENKQRSTGQLNEKLGRYQLNPLSRVEVEVFKPALKVEPLVSAIEDCRTLRVDNE
jgi:hypothetical protein